MRKGLVLPALIILFALVTMAHGDLITDGSFEVNTNSTPGNSQGSEIGASTYAGSTWGNDDVLTHWDKTGNRTWYVTDGGAVRFPDGDFAYRLDGAVNDGVDKLYQDGILLTAGVQHTLTFEMWGENGTPHVDVEFTGPATLKVFDNESTDGTDGLTETKTVQFTPTVTGSYTINFFADDPPGAHAWIDSVSLIPEPTTLVLTTLGLGLLGVRRRRK